MFNLGMPEVAVVALLLWIFLGKARLPDVREALIRTRRGANRRPPPHEAFRSSWTSADWFLVAVTTALAGTLAAALLHHRAHT